MPDTNLTMDTYEITHSHGLTETEIATYAEAVAKVREVYGADCEIGHSGDCEDGGEKTLVWTDAAEAENDDGSRACCSIHKSHEEAE